jgi:RNase P/RNase MRP subunit p30
MEGAQMENLDLTQLLERKNRLSEAMAGIKSMRRGTLNEVYHRQKLKDGTEVMRGPFYNITTKSGKNKTVTVAVPKKDIDLVRKEVQNYKDFRASVDEYIDVCERISMLTVNGETDCE